jgi:medium-chain acyl-[acyl-carrier-protein] hydrolase
MITMPIPMFCVPYAGGTARAYQQWRRQFPPDLEVVPLEIAGRGRRVTEPFFTSIHEVAEDLAAQVRAHEHLAADYVLFGHSMGALTAFELAARLADHGLLTPALVVLSGRNPPYLRAQWVPEVLELPDRDLLELLEELGGVPTGLPPSIAARFFLPRLRADLRFAIEYQLGIGDTQLDIPLLILQGRSDPLIDPEHMEGWARYTRRECTVEYHDGGHFALFEAIGPPEELIGAVRGMLVRSSRFTSATRAGRTGDPL